MYLVIMLLLLYPIEPLIWVRTMGGLGYKYTNNKRYYQFAAIGYYLITVIKQLLTIKLDSDILNTTMGLVLTGYMFFCTIKLYEGKILKKIAWISVFFGLIFVTELFVIFVPTFILKISNEMFSKPSMGAVLCTLFAKSMLWVICDIFYKKNEYSVMYSIATNRELIPLMIATILFEMPASAIIKSCKLHGNKVAIGICYGVQIMLTVVTISTFWLGKRRNDYLEYIKAELENVKRASTATDKLSELKHDICGHVDIMYSLCKSKQYDFLERYLEEVYKATDMLDTVYVFCDPALSVVIGNMHKRASKLGIRFDVLFSIRRLYMSSFDMCSLITNLLNNAIEGTEKLPSDKRNIKLVIDYIRDGYSIECKNTSQRGVNILETSKEDKDNHGYGRKIIESIVYKHKGKVYWSEETDKDGNNVFISTIEFKVKEIMAAQEKSKDLESKTESLQEEGNY